MRTMMSAAIGPEPTFALGAADDRSQPIPRHSCKPQHAARRRHEGREPVIYCRIDERQQCADIRFCKASRPVPNYRMLMTAEDTVPKARLASECDAKSKSARVKSLAHWSPTRLVAYRSFPSHKGCISFETLAAIRNEHHYHRPASLMLRPTNRRRNPF